jgi:photosystem II stability/assembly factor-like uncharacterized protein
MYTDQFFRVNDSLLFAAGQNDSFGDGGIFTSSDCGVTWTFYSNDSKMYPARLLVISPRGIPVVARWWGKGLSRSEDGGLTWIESNKGIARNDVNTLVVADDQSIIVGTARGGFFRSSDKGNTWYTPTMTVSDGYSSYVVSIRKNTRGNLFAATMGGQNMVWRSTSNGDVWEPTRYTDSLRTSLGIEPTISAMTIDDRDNLIVSGFVPYQTAKSGVFNSTDNGITWKHIITAPGGSDAISFLMLPGGIVIAGCQHNGLYRFDTSDSLWRHIVTTSDMPAIPTLICDSAGVLFAGSLGAGILRSVDEGNHWIFSNNGLNDLTVRTLAVLPGNVIFAGTERGAFFSTDHGLSWKEENDLDRTGSIRFIYTERDGSIYLATSGGVYEGMIILSINENFIHPRETILHQNFPNPFNPSTIISYQVTSLCKVSLKVYDLVGREVATLVNNMKSAGSYNATFNGINMPSGIYFYRLQAGKFTQTKKLILVK